MVQIVLAALSLWAIPVESATTFSPLEFIKYAKPELSIGTQKQYVGWILKAAEKYSESPALITAIIMVESGFDSDAIGPVGEVGLMQLRPKFFGDAELLRDPRTNIFKGTRYISQLRQRHWDTYHSLKFIEHYNCGSSCNPVKFKYFKRVMRIYGRLSNAAY